GQSRYYALPVGPDHTVRLALDSLATKAANEVYVRFGNAPEPAHYELSFQTPFSPDQIVTIPTTLAGTYYVLVRGNYVPDGAATFSLVAHIVPLTVDDVTPDEGGDHGFVTTTITGAGFQSAATVHFVRPGFADLTPES